jgi:hypothetical protein
MLRGSERPNKLIAIPGDRRRTDVSAGYLAKFTVHGPTSVLGYPARFTVHGPTVTKVPSGIEQRYLPGASGDDTEAGYDISKRLIEVDSLNAIGLDVG